MNTITRDIMNDMNDMNDYGHVRTTDTWRDLRRALRGTSPDSPRPMEPFMPPSFEEEACGLSTLEIPHMDAACVSGDGTGLLYHIAGCKTWLDMAELEEEDLRETLHRIDRTLTDEWRELSHILEGTDREHPMTRETPWATLTAYRTGDGGIRCRYDSRRLGDGRWVDLARSNLATVRQALLDLSITDAEAEEAMRTLTDMDILTLELDRTLI